MKNKSLIVILASVVSLLCLYFLSFTFIAKSIEGDADSYAKMTDGTINNAKRQNYLDSLWTKPAFNFAGLEFTYKEVKEQSLHLGLDLQGGMHVVIEVSPNEIIRNLASGYKDPRFDQALAAANEKSKTSNEKFASLFVKSFKQLAPDVKLSTVFGNSSTRGRIDFNTSDADVQKIVDGEIEGAIDRSFNILRTRIDKFGTTQPNIQRLKGTNRIQLELPGVDNPERVRKLLSGTAKLEFLQVWEAEKFGPYFDQLNKFLVKIEEEGGLASTKEVAIDTNKSTNSADNLFANADSSNKESKTDVKAKSDTSKSNRNSSLIAKLFVPIYNGLGARVSDTGKVNQLFARSDVKAMLPSNMKILWDIKPIEGKDKEEFLAMYFVKKGRDGKAPLTGEAISGASNDFDQSGRPEVMMQMNASGAKKWRRLTAENIGKQIAIVLDDYVYSAPTVQGEIPNGSSSISGSFTIEEAKDLANILKAGKLPAPTRIVEEAIVGPSLGQEAISQGLSSSLIGLLLVVIFMVFYYSSGGGIADIALFINMFLLMGILTQMQAVLTLPGIAGIVLTIGMAVDANVLIYERIRIEISNGKSLKDAIKAGFEKANSSIVDGNVTTFLVGVILATYGSGPVQGFAVTLMIGIVTSFFTSIFISRIIIEWWSEREGATPLKFSTRMTENLFKNLKFDIISKRKMAYAFSSAVIVIGFACIVFNGGLNLGVDFKGGRSYVVKFNQQMVASDVRDVVSNNFSGAGTEVKTFGSSDKLKITTSYLTDDETEEGDQKVLSALNKGLEKYSSLNPQILSSSKVGATIADDIKNTSYISGLLAIGGIFLYILLRFRKLEYSLGAIMALIHDVLITIAITGIFNTLGVAIEVDQIYLAAILTIIGYSINDTVVIYDRIREYLTENPNAEIGTSVNAALNDTFSRTIITALTVFIVVAILLVFGGEVLRGFSFAMVIGVVFGSYSTLFIASPMVMDLAKKKKNTAEA